MTIVALYWARPLNFGFLWGVGANPTLPKVAPVFAVGFVPREQLETLTCPEPDSELVWTCSWAQGL